MLLGNQCTRSCRFCAVPSGRPIGLDKDEPRRVVEAIRSMRLEYVVLTSVARDDLDDGGSSIFAETITRIREAMPDTTIEILIPDFEGSMEALSSVLRAGPDVLNHNLETVSRFQPVIRPQGSYGRSLEVLKFASEWTQPPSIKSGVMLGLGESEEELYDAFEDLLTHGCEMLTLGQYLRPSREHLPVARYVKPEEFDRYAERARTAGFKAVASGPMVRSSYRAEELLQEVLTHRRC